MVGYRPAYCFICARQTIVEPKLYCLREAKHNARRGYALPFALKVTRKHIINRDKVLHRCKRWFTPTELVAKLMGEAYGSSFEEQDQGTVTDPVEQNVRDDAFEPAVSGGDR